MSLWPQLVKVISSSMHIFVVSGSEYCTMPEFPLREEEEEEEEEEAVQ